MIETRVRGVDGWVIETPELDADWDRARDLLRARGLSFVNENWMFRVDGAWFTPAALIAHLSESRINAEVRDELLARPHDRRYS